MGTDVRYRFAREGAKTTIGIAYEIGAIELPEGPLDISLGAELNPDTLFGTAFNFQREANGDLTCEIEFEDDADQKMIDMLGSQAFLTVRFAKHRALLEPGLKTVEWARIDHLFVIVDADPWAD